MQYARILAVALGLLICTSTLAQTGEATGASSDEIKALKEDMDSVKKELKAIRGDLRRVLTEIGKIKTATPSKPPQRKPDTTVYKIELGESAVRGPKDAPVTIVEYASFACGYCIREDPVLKKVLEAYPKDVRLVVKHFPLWPKAHQAHAAAALAKKQKGDEGFWKMHDLIIKGGTRKLTVKDLRGYAEQVGLDMAEFDAVMADEAKVKQMAEQDTAKGRTFNVRGTPTVFINGLKLSPRGFDKYKARIDAILKEKGKGKAGA